MVANIVVLNSDLRDSPSTIQAAKYTLINVGGVEGTYEVIDYASINQIASVEVGVNDTLYWDAGAGDVSAIIPPGFYATQTDLNAAAKIVMDAVAAPNFTFTIDPATGRVTVAVDVGTFGWTFGINTARSARVLLGLIEANFVAAVSIISNFPPSLVSHTHIAINVSEDGTKNVNLLPGTELSALIPLNESYGEPMQARKLQNYQQTVFFASNLTTLNISLFTEDGSALVNTPKYVLVLRKIF